MPQTHARQRTTSVTSGAASQSNMQQDESEVSDRELIDAVEAYENNAFYVERQEHVCANDRLVVGAELLSSMQQDESEVSDRELIAALEAYESHEAHDEGQENACANDSPVADVELLAATSWLENYLQQRDVTKTGQCPSVYHVRALYLHAAPGIKNPCHFPVSL